MTQAKGKAVKATVPVAVKAAPVPLKVAIVGCSDTKSFAPYSDPSWEIWAMNNAFHTERRTKWFEIHPVKKVGDQFLRRKLITPGVFEWSPEFRGMPMDKYVAMLNEIKCPIYMQRHWDEIPLSVPYPLEEVTARFGRYFTNSVSFMIALAIMKGASEIGCYGVDMATGSEYGPQRPSCEYFLGIARGMGIKVTIPEQADLLKTRFLYAFEEREQVAWEAKMMNMMSAMEQRKAKAVSQFEMAQKQINQYVGAQEALREIQRIWSNLADTKIWSDPS